MAQVSRGNAAGFAYLQLFLVGANGYAYGTAGPSASNGTTTHAHLVREVRTFGLQLGEPPRTNFTGGDHWLGQKMWGMNEVPSFSLGLSVFDMTFDRIIKGITLDQTTNQAWSILGEGVNVSQRPQVGLLLSQYFQSRESGSDGADLWLNCLIPRCYISAQGQSMEYQAEALRTYSVAVTMADCFPNGVAFGANQDFPGNREAVLWCITNNPLAITTNVNNAATTFSLAYLPASSVVTLGNSPNWMAINGTATAPASVNTSTGVVTKVSAGNAGDLDIIIYEVSMATGDFAAVP